MQIELAVVEGQILKVSSLLDGIFLLANNNETKIELLLDDAPSFEEIKIFDTTLLQLLQSCCESLKIRPERIMIKSGNLIQDTTLWIKMERRTRLAAFLYGQYINYDIQKKFTHVPGIFVGRCSWSRLYLASYINEIFTNNSLITFWQHHFDAGQPANLFIDQILLHTQQNRNTLQMITNFCKKLPLHLSDADRQANKNIGTINYRDSYQLIEHYHKIFLEVVCETMHHKNTFYPTEKISRSLITKTPFLVYGPVGYLKNLKKIGFKTFEDFWDESYDNFHEFHRIKKIQIILNKINEKSQEEIKKLYSDMLPILEHNQKIYKNISDDEIGEIFNCTKSD